jgi:activator of HSP90 ATPase
MAQVIEQQEFFESDPDTLFEYYMNSRLHWKITEEKAIVHKRTGSPFSAYNKYIEGKILHLDPGKMIVQTWRCKDWSKKDPDSILILTFSAAGKNTTLLELVHANVPDRFIEDIKAGWKDSYWEPWKNYIKNLQEKK